MLARKKGILSSPRVRTRASVVPKKDKPIPTDSDSDTTVILDHDNKSPVPAKTKPMGRNKNTNKKRKQKTFITKTYVLRKGGLPRRARNKRKKQYLFKCSPVRKGTITSNGNTVNFNVVSVRNFFALPVPSTYTNTSTEMVNSSVKSVKPTFRLKVSLTTIWSVTVKPGITNVKSPFVRRNLPTKAIW